MTKLVADFSDLAAGATSTFTLDFGYDLPTGDTIVSAVFTLIVTSGTDASPSSRLSGPATILGNLASQTITGTPAGVRYVLRGLATTTLGNSISIFSHVRSV